MNSGLKMTDHGELKIPFGYFFSAFTEKKIIFLGNSIIFGKKIPMKKLLALLAFGLFALNAEAQTSINPFYWGQSYWYTKMNSTNPSNNVDLSNWGDVSGTNGSGAKLIRVGGTNYNIDNNFFPYDNVQSRVYPEGYVNIVDNVRANGCEPIITVPHSNSINSGVIASEAQTAGEIVRVLNKVHKRGVRFFIIANEPGINYGSPNFLHSSPYTTYAQNVADYIKPFAIEMKKIDPDIIIIGPEMEWYDDNIGQLLISASTNSYSITGIIPNNNGLATGKYYIDIFSFHTYPMDPNDHPSYTKTSAYNNPVNFKNNIALVQSHFSSASRTSNDLGIAVDEFNIIYDHNNCLNNMAMTTTDIDDGGTCLNPNSFLAGQWMTDMMCTGLANGLRFMNFWSVQERGNRTGTNNDALGYLHGTSDEKKPTWHHYKMLTDFFQGDFYDGLNNGNTSYMDNGIKAYACQNHDHFAVLLINETSSQKSYEINFSNSSPSSGNEKIKFNTPLGWSNFTSSSTGYAALAGQTTMVLLFDCSGNCTDRFVLSQADMINAFPNNYPSYTRTHPYGSTSIPTYSFSTNPTQDVSSQKCLGDHTTSASISGVSNATFAWNTVPAGIGPLSTSSSASNLLPGAYTVDIITSCGTSRIPFTINEKSPLVHAASSGNCTSSITVSTTITENSYGYNWAPGSVSNYQAASTGATPSGPTTYTITVDDGTCTVSDITAVAPQGSSADVFIGDSPGDIGSEPNGESLAELNGQFWLSSDIWNRRTLDGVPIQENPNASSYNYMYVKLTNRGCGTVTNGTLKVYYAKAATVMDWPSYWSPVNYCTCNNSLTCGDQLGTTNNTINMSGTSTTTAIFTWTPPDPATYSSCSQFVGNEGHFCILAHFDYPASNIDPLPSLSNSTWTNCYNWNNVAQKNVEIVCPSCHNGPEGAIWIINDSVTHLIDLDFNSANDQYGRNVLDFARLRLYCTKQMITSWREGGQKGQGIMPVNDSVVEVTRVDASMKNIFMQYGQMEKVALEVIPFGLPSGAPTDYFIFDMKQKRIIPGAITTAGGERFLIEKKDWDVTPCFQAVHNTFSGTLTQGEEFSIDTLQLTANVVVPSGYQLYLHNLVVVVDEGVKITVQKGGDLQLFNAEFISSCSGKKWGGIVVKGGNDIKSTFAVSGCFFSGTDTPFHIDSIAGVHIRTNSLLGSNNGRAVYLYKMKDFDISGNTIFNFETGVASSKSNGYTSSISKNIILEVDTCLYFDHDDNTQMDVLCNRFGYSEYAIRSASADQKALGTSSDGAGNEFISTSTNTYDKYYKTSGISVTYHDDPSFPVTSGMNITVSTATDDAECYIYSFDTTSSKRFAKPHLNSVSSGLDVFAVPNPNTGKAGIHFSLGTAHNGELSILDIYGKVMDRFAVSDDKQVVEVDYSKFASGIYILTLTTPNGELKTEKMLISK
jgi:hypothetical protein